MFQVEGWQAEPYKIGQSEGRAMAADRVGAARRRTTHCKPARSVALTGSKPDGAPTPSRFQRGGSQGCRLGNDSREGLRFGFAGNREGRDSPRCES
jgi:hypothetical protein